MPSGNSLRVRFSIFGRLRVHQAGGALLHQFLDADAVDQVDRVEHVALGLGHLLAFRIADQAVHIHIPERDLAGDVLGHHHHARHPEEDDVEAGDQHRGRQIFLQVRIPCVFGCVAGPVKRGERPQRGGEPGIEHVGIAVELSGVTRLHRPDGAPRLRRAQRTLRRSRHTMQVSDVPTTAGARCTSPGCCSATGCRCLPSFPGGT